MVCYIVHSTAEEHVTRMIFLIWYILDNKDIKSPIKINYD